MDLFDYAQRKAEEETAEEVQPTEAIYSVGEITAEIKSLLEGSYGRERIWIKGEVSNFKGRNQTGHIYFNLKDQDAVLGCAFFRGANRSLDFELKDGLEVLAAGRISVYPPRGSYQLIVEELRPGGVGELHLRFEQLKRKLETEGLFAEERKRPLPPFPERIGIVTSLTGAVLRDMIHVLRRRCPFVTLIVLPAKVQGEGAAQEISAAVSELNDPSHKLDLIVVARGGGSIEDLWAFNEEIVARAIATSRLPVVSAVGHQTDYTISDFVADKRAATPSQAAELIVPDVMDLKRRVDLLIRSIARELAHGKERLGGRLEALTRSPFLRNPRVFVQARGQRLALAVERMVTRLTSRRDRETQRIGRAQGHLSRAMATWMAPLRLRFEKISSNLGLLDPLAILARGYSVATAKDGTIVKTAGQVRTGDALSVRLHEGKLLCEVKKTFET